MATDSKGVPGSVASLAEGSESIYFPGQVRKCGPGQARVQLKPKTEHTVAVSEKLASYLEGLKHTLTSVAGTATLYAPCQMRHFKCKLAELQGPDGQPVKMIEGSDTKKTVLGVKVQVKGPTFNAPFGAEFFLVGTGLYVSVASKLGAKLPVDADEAAESEEGPDEEGE